VRELFCPVSNFAQAAAGAFEHDAALRAGTYFALIHCNRESVPDPRSRFMQNESGHIVETAVESRAGFLDRPTLTVLIVSTGLIIALFALIYIGFFAR
jgi:hypothetical protein